jgi:hypothetical protein
MQASSVTTLMGINENGGKKINLRLLSQNGSFIGKTTKQSKHTAEQTFRCGTNLGFLTNKS